MWAPDIEKQGMKGIKDKEFGLVISKKPTSFGSLVIINVSRCSETFLDVLRMLSICFQDISMMFTRCSQTVLMIS